jgi:hypothetical protein
MSNPARMLETFGGPWLDNYYYYFSNSGSRRISDRIDMPFYSFAKLYMILNFLSCIFFQPLLSVG